LDVGAQPAPDVQPIDALARTIEAQPRWVIWRVALGASLLFWVVVVIGLALLF
jgi:type II secretory pathway component PulL